MDPTKEELAKVEELQMLLKGELTEVSFKMNVQLPAHKKIWVSHIIWTVIYGSVEHLATNGSIANHARQLISKHISDKDFLLKFVRGRKLDLDKALRSVSYYPVTKNARVIYLTYLNIFTYT